MFDYIAYYQDLLNLLSEKKEVWQAIVTKTDGSTPARVGMHLAVSPDGNPLGNLGGGNLEFKVIELIREKRVRKVESWFFDLDEEGMPISKQEIPTNMICGGKVEVLVEPLFSAHPLIIIGGGHCGKALADLALKCGFKVTIIDNRREVLQHNDFPGGCELVYNDYESIEQVISFSAHTYLVIMTYGHIYDKQVVEQCLRQPFSYLGMIGSKKKADLTLNNLRKQGFSEEELDKVNTPIGINIGSHTPYEIAVSIMAQLIRVRNILNKGIADD